MNKIKRYLVFYIAIAIEDTARAVVDSAIKHRQADIELLSWMNPILLIMAFGKNWKKWFITKQDGGAYRYAKGDISFSPTGQIVPRWCMIISTQFFNKK